MRHSFITLVGGLASVTSLWAMTFTVTVTDDSGPGSLRQAMLDANTTAGSHRIEFDISGPGPHVIVPQSLLPPVTNTVTIDGYTQPGASTNTLPEGDNAVLLVELHGSAVPSGQAPGYGLYVTAGNCVVRGLAINAWPGHGILLEKGVSNRVEGEHRVTNK